MSSSAQLASKIYQDYFRTPPSSEAAEMGRAQKAEDILPQRTKTLAHRRAASSAVRHLQLSGLEEVGVPAAEISLPSEHSEAIDNFRRERYVNQLLRSHKGVTKNPLIRKAYYSVREFLPVGVRRHFQKAYFKGWQQISFPRWPVDFTADILHETFLASDMRAHGIARVPFIWFWPEGASACAIVTHDVETGHGRDFSSTLMDIDASFGFRASFQVIPEKRYEVPLSYWNEIRSRGFEFNVHDLNHDGRLFQDHGEFERRVKLINAYGEKYEARGFRAGAMYRNQDWFSSLKFSYDMSVPNVAHLEPQRGGCCTVMPYFVGDILEIPLTTSQDYSVFNILETYSLDLWKKQIELILRRNGLLSFLSHPDYLLDAKARHAYESLLAHLREVCDRNGIWHVLPRELDSWWRARNEMHLVETADGLQIRGPLSHRARIAYANLDGDRIVYTVA